MESLTENRLNDIASSAIIQVHNRCFISWIWTYQNAKRRHGPPKNRLWPASGPKPPVAR